MRRTLRSVVVFLVPAALSVAIGSAGLAQEVSLDGDDILIQFDEIEGTPLDDFIKLCQLETGKQLNYNNQETRDTRLKFLGEKRLPRDQFWPYFQAVLRAYDYVVVPYGNISTPGQSPEGPDTGFFSIRRTAGAGTVGGGRVGYIKSGAPVVSPDQLEAFKYDPGIVLTTSFTLRYVNTQEATNMLQTYFTDPNLESVRAVTNSNSLVATGFAQTLYGIKRLLDLIDTKPDEFTPKFASVQLEHAVAEEIQPIVKELIDAERGVGGAAGRNVAAGGAGLPASLQEFDPQISVDPRSNALLVVAAEMTLEKILHYIRMLDVEVDPRGDTHVYRLKNSAAIDLEEILTQWLDSTGAGTSGGTATAGAQATGARNALEQQPTVVADEASNSLIITASKSRYAQVLEIIKRLDIRRRQVLIETALVEISGTLNERLGVELGYVSVDETPSKDSNRGFGVSSFGLSTLTDTDGDGIVDFRVPFGLSDGASGTSGITAGIFSGKDFAVPLVINALKSTGDANVLSMPSVLVNDNEEAVISSTDERPTFNVSQGVNSDQTSFDNFQEAGITLNISPSISAGNYLRLLAKLTVSNFTEPDGNPPPRATREIETNVTLPDGHTMVIGGVVADDQRSSRDQIPWLGDLPLFGWFFRNDNEANTRTNLYVFITPHIISDDFANLDDLSYAKKKEMEALNGKISLVDPDWDRDNADTRVLDAGVSGVFDLPSYASPPGGEIESLGSTVAPKGDGTTWGDGEDRR